MIEGKRVYGYLEPYDPVVISWHSFKSNPDTFIQASYDKRILEKLFPNNGEFPNISFTYSQIRYLTWQQMCDLCKGFGIKTKRENKFRRRELRSFMRENC